ncbi:cysteine synthase A [Romboutsia ilealis]|uniref:Cysteine synthase A n=1 Tax=Romboutsia faecis TaxID=2764597 RepID=A0ABR7JNT3_9FIRM|nr:cysteine synthase A [Romboutsia faecis]MBC5996568.1 cysteine synthase A [Romboutsia faecis]MRN24094.1 cysteine synthase A [Romboutsia ilealis]
MIYEDALSLIGNTPMIRLNRLGYPNVYVKLELNNPAGSIKDRAVYAMIDGAERRNELKKGDVLVEATSGNTGIALAMIGRLKGYKVIIIMPETMSIERRELVQAYGAELILTQGSKGMNGAVEKANELLKLNLNYKSLGQFENEDNKRGHYEHTGVEIYNDLPDIDIFTCGIGTGGTLSGTGKYLKEKNPNVKIIGIEPKSSPLISEGKAGGHKIQGIGANFIPKNYDEEVCDEIITISDEDAFDMVRQLGQMEGLLVGISAGANIFAAIELSKLYKNKKIVTVAPDGINKYMSMGIF